MEPEIIERRKAMLKLAFRGVGTSEWVRKIAAKYGVAEKTIWNEWNRRREWMGKVFDLDDPTAAAAELLVEKRLLKEEAWQLYLDARERDINGMVGALNLANRIAKEEFEIRQSLGELNKMLGELKLDDKIKVSIAPVPRRIMKARRARAEAKADKRSAKPEPEEINVNVTPAEKPLEEKPPEEKPKEEAPPEEKPKEEKPKVKSLEKKTIKELLQA
jgi:hypothetical protein